MVRNGKSLLSWLSRRFMSSKIFNKAGVQLKLFVGSSKEAARSHVSGGNTLVHTPCPDRQWECNCNKNKSAGKLAITNGVKGREKREKSCIKRSEILERGEYPSHTSCLCIECTRDVLNKTCLKTSLKPPYLHSVSYLFKVGSTNLCFCIGTSLVPTPATSL